MNLSYTFACREQWQCHFWTQPVCSRYLKILPEYHLFRQTRVKDALGCCHGLTPRRGITRVRRVCPAIDPLAAQNSAGSKQLPAAALFPLSSAPSTSPVAPEFCPGRVSASLPLIPLARLVSRHRRRRPPPSKPPPLLCSRLPAWGAQKKFLLVGACSVCLSLLARPSIDGGADGCASEGGSDDWGLQSLPGTKSEDRLAEQDGAERTRQQRIKPKTNTQKTRRVPAVALLSPRSSFLCYLMEIMDGSCVSKLLYLPHNRINSNRDIQIPLFYCTCIIIWTLRITELLWFIFHLFSTEHCSAYRLCYRVTITRFTAWDYKNNTFHQIFIYWPIQFVLPLRYQHVFYKYECSVQVIWDSGISVSLNSNIIIWSHLWWVLVLRRPPLRNQLHVPCCRCLHD